MKARATALLCGLCLTAGCAEAPEEPAPLHAGPRYATSLGVPDDLVALSDGDLAVKYLAPLEPGELAPPLENACVFQDMHDADWHVGFLNGFPDYAELDFETYLSWVLRRETRQMWGGAVRWWSEGRHPRTGEPGVVSFAVYADTTERDRLTVDDVVAVHRRLAGCIDFPSHRLVFVADGPVQEAFVQAQRGRLEAAGVAATDPASLAVAEVEVYSPGTGYGTLFLGESLPEGYGGRDVLVLGHAPNDIGIVGGLVTSQPQNLHSHVNLRLEEKNIPNGRIPDALADPALRALEGQLVKIVAAGDRVMISAADRAEAEAFWGAAAPDVGQPVSDLSETRVLRFREMGWGSADAYGAKADNLAELSRAFGPSHAPNGFAIPFASYVAHLESSGAEPLIDAFLADPRRHDDPAWRAGALDDIRDALRDGPLDPDLLAQVVALARDWLGDDALTTRLRFRSSTNVEDLEALSGAGLYDSKSGCLGDDLDGDDEGPSQCLSASEERALREQLAARRVERERYPQRTWLDAVIADIEGDLTKEKPVARALPRVWRSLWNDRAWSEREYYGIDHRLAYMGVAVNPSFVQERLNAVVVTNLGDVESAFRVISQRAPESVVRPDDPWAVAEVRVLTRTSDGFGDELLVPSSLAEGSLWSDEQLARLAPLLFAVHDHFAALYDDVDANFDLEVKLTSDGSIVLKQIRPYLTGAP